MNKKIIKWAALSINTGPLENYGLDEDLSTPNIEELFRYEGPQALDMFDPYGGPGVGQEDEQDLSKDLKKDFNNLKIICLDCEDIEQTLEMPEIKDYIIISLNKKMPNAEVIYLNKEDKENFVNKIKPNIVISSDLSFLVKLSIPNRIYVWEE